MDKKATIALQGLGTALITPFNPDGSVDFEALDRVLDTQLIGEIDFIVVLGTTGEAVTMTDDEKALVRSFIELKVGRRIPLVLGVGGNCTQRVVEELGRLGDELTAHYSAILSVCPYYNKPSQEGLYQHFKAIAEVSPVPVLLYNVPGRTGINIVPQTVMRLHQDCGDKICGIKEASGKVDQIHQLIDLMRDEDFLVLSGDDGIAAELMAYGADGLISVASNAYAHDFYQLVHAYDGMQKPVIDMVTIAPSIQQKYEQMVRLLFVEGNPAGIKTVLAQHGLIDNVLRLPLVPNSLDVQNQIAQEDKQL